MNFPMSTQSNGGGGGNGANGGVTRSLLARFGFGQDVKTFPTGPDSTNYKPVEVVFMDMDGTFLDDDHQIPADTLKATLEAIKEGVTIVPTSGKPSAAIARYDHLLRMSNPLVISHHGARIEISGRLIPGGEFPIDKEAAGATIQGFDSLDEALRGNATFLYFVNGNTSLFREASSPIMDEYQTRNPPERLTYIQFGHKESHSRFLLNGLPDKILFLTPNKDYASRLKAALTEKLANYGVRVMISNGTYVEVVDKKANKGNAALTVLAYLRITDPKLARAFGDGESDLLIHNIAGVPIYLMGNTPNELKAKYKGQSGIIILGQDNNSGVIGDVLSLELLARQNYQQQKRQPPTS